MNRYSFEEWRRAATQIKPIGDAYIGGRRQLECTGGAADVVNPATEQVIGQMAVCDEGEINDAVAAAREAFESGTWSCIPPSDRRSALQRLAGLIREHAVELALLDSLCVGKPVVNALSQDVPASAALFDYYAEALDKRYGEVAPAGASSTVLVERVPLGVVGVVVPWNFPLGLFTWKVAPALAAGNCVVVKPSEEAPFSALRIAELATEAGLPDGVLNVVPGYGEVSGALLGSHEDVDCIAFTGSTQVGRKFLGYSASSNGKQVWLECGGKSANLVFDDVESLDVAVEAAVWGVFANQGEVCSANSRILLDVRIKEAFVEAFISRARAIRVGDPLDPCTQMGPLVSRAQLARVSELVDDGRRSCTLRLGGDDREGEGFFMDPVVFDDVPAEARVAREEVFGPVACLFTFDSEEEAVAMANSSRYGLAASVWSSNASRIHRVTNRLRAGTVSVNAVDIVHPTVPFGGFGASGYGRDLSLHALDKYTGLKATWNQF